jgi:TRAP-type C4-dicarboxylate transport system permease small subunit
MVTKTTKFFKRAGSLLLNIIERGVPTLTFTALFIVFMVQVFCRYVLAPLTWPLEFTLIAFIWTTVFGACFAQRDSSHVTFTLIYERTKPKGQLIMRILGNLLVVSSFCIALYPSYKYVDFMSFKHSDVLKIPMNIAFSPFLVFLVIMIARFGYDLVIDIRKLLRGQT